VYSVLIILGGGWCIIVNITRYCYEVRQIRSESVLVMRGGNYEGGKDNLMIHHHQYIKNKFLFPSQYLNYFGNLNTFAKNVLSFIVKYSKSKNINIYVQQATTWKISVRRLSKGVFVICIFVVEIFMVTRWFWNGNINFDF